jgi:predicted transcriptional regulator
MPCIDSQGHMSEAARRILDALEQPQTPENAASLLNLPLYRVRSGVREMVEAGLLSESNGTFVATPRGRQLAAEARTA